MADHIHIVYKKAALSSISGDQTDLVHMVKALKEIGQNIHLHCFYPERIQLDSIAMDCQKIHAYCSTLKGHPHKPSFIKEEINRLKDNLMHDDAPIIFHGFYSSVLHLDFIGLEDRRILIRLLREEPAYLLNLAKVTPWGMMKFRYLNEYIRSLGKYKQLLQKTIVVSSFSLGKKARNSRTISSFKGQITPFFKEGNGSFCLYFGDLSKMENEYTARWLLEHIFNKLEIPFVVAGSNPTASLEQAAHVRMHTCLVSNPSDLELSELIKKAQVVLMPSFIEQQSQDNILKSLLWGRHVLVNNKATQESAFARWMEIAETPELFRAKIESLFAQPFQEAEKNRRLEEIESLGSDATKARELISLLS